MTIQEFRLAVLHNAIADIGKGEVGENNWGLYVKGILNGVGIDFPASWCAAAVWNWIEKAIGSKNYASVPKIAQLRTPSAKAMFNAAREVGWIVSSPQPGDLVFFKRPGENWYAHVGVVEDVIHDKDESSLINPIFDDTTVHTIEGNKGPFPAKVRRYEYTTPIADLLGYVRLLGE